MRSWILENARHARQGRSILDDTLIVVDDEQSAVYWRKALRGVTAQAEIGRKGNFLGALQAHHSTGSLVGDRAPYRQVAMLVGSGTRVSPIAQSLRNSKASHLLPSKNADGNILMMGEAALIATTPIADHLSGRGFHGTVYRWADEIVIPSTHLNSTSAVSDLAGVDVVRFGYKVRPSALLASQKEWLLTDPLGRVEAELPRQELNSLLIQLASKQPGRDPFVNLGSFAASHAFLNAFCHAFSDLLYEPGVTANWDPYFWAALHSNGEGDWMMVSAPDGQPRPSDFDELLQQIPDFWRRTQDGLSRLQAAQGRPFRATVLDFGTPYWIDSGHHASLRAFYDDIFSPSEEGRVVRAFLGLTEGLARGENCIINSNIAPGTQVQNSIIIDSRIEDPSSLVERTVVLGSWIGRLISGPGAVVVQSKCGSLEMDGPHSISYRVQGDRQIGGSEIVAGISLPNSIVHLSHDDPMRTVTPEIFMTPQGGNSMSFADASESVANIAASELDAQWLRVLDWDGFGQANEEGTN